MISKDKICIKVLYFSGEDPFICGVNGCITVRELLRIEEDFQSDDFAIFSDDGCYTLDAVFFEEEWHGYECEPSSWDFSVMSFDPIEMGE